MQKGNGRKIVVGMSGGVDSSVALILLKQNGWDPIGVSLKFGVWNSSCNSIRENSCCTDKSVKIAKEVCKKYRCKHYVLNVSKNFHEKVINYFTKTLQDLKTPNPCIICNRYLKFLELFEYTQKNGISYIATGHYAKIVKSKKYKGYYLSRPKDQTKDQTYYLSLLPQKWLENIIFPLSNLTKEEVYKIAKKEGLDFFLKLSQSQDCCFVSEKSLAQFIDKNIGNESIKSGNIVDLNGKVFGKHKGLAHYTIGQRKNIGLGGGPFFVVKKDKKRNELIVSKSKSDISFATMQLKNCYFPGVLPNKVTDLKVKIRYQHTPSRAKSVTQGSHKYKVAFETPQIAVTPGQYAVFYSKDLVLGAGEIL